MTLELLPSGGSNVPLAEIAKATGVGVGTFYPKSIALGVHGHTAAVMLITSALLLIS